MKFILIKILVYVEPRCCLSTLNKLNVVKSFRGKSGIVNEVFLKAEKSYEIAVKQPYDMLPYSTLEEIIYNNNIDRIIGKNRGNLDNIN